MIPSSTLADPERIRRNHYVELAGERLEIRT